MNTRLSRWLLLVISLVALILRAAAAVDSVAFEAAARLLAAGRAEEATRAFERLAQTGRTSPAIERNWALACEQSGLPAHALLHFRRASLLAPRDPDIRADLKTLRSKLGRAGGSETADDRWIRTFGVDEWGWLAFASNWIWCGCLIAGLLVPSIKAALRGFTVASGTVTLLLLALTVTALLDFRSRPDAIVLKADTVLRQSPIDEARTAFTAPMAAELKVRDSRPGWVMGEDLASGRFGWVPRQQLGFVIP